MFYIGFYKGWPSDYVIKFVNGKIKKQGHGISFFYSKRKATILAVPAVTKDSFFVFNEKTKSFQSVTIQGQLTYRIIDYNKITQLLDFSVDPAANTFKTDDYQKLPQRIINAVQLFTKEEIADLTLEETLSSTQNIVKNVMQKMSNSRELLDMGLECLSIYFTSISPTPEIASALEAEYREELQKKADEAIYSRRAAAVEQEKIIKENEINSKIEISKKESELVEIEGNNTLKEAEYRAKATEKELNLYKDISPRTLLAMGLKSLGENAASIGNVSITPELLSTILQIKDM